MASLRRYGSATAESESVAQIWTVLDAGVFRQAPEPQPAEVDALAEQFEPRANIVGERPLPPPTSIGHINRWHSSSGRSRTSEATRHGTIRFWTLHQLWNADKHRALHALPIYPNPEHLLKEGFTFPPGVVPLEQKVLVRRNRPLQDGTKLALMRFDRPVSAMNVEIALRMQVALSDKQGDDDRGALRDTLGLFAICWMQAFTPLG